MIELLKISHSYDNIKIINDLSLNIQDEGITVISGANGSGKTTLLKIISKILIPDFGIVKTSNESLYKKRVGYVFQKPILLKRNVYENLSFILKKDNLASSSIKKIINKYLVKFFNNKDFDNFLKKNIFELSGGEQQIISLIRTISTKPKLLFLDEPFANLDDEHCNMLSTLLSDISKNGSKIIMVTHKSDIAKKLSKDIVLL
jgi:ABC-type multidrug transport system ATPase subunit|tara:strand:+ start:201 stop:809 length:609 start_codon:yes stop_codon:yes gene_type:complete